MKCSFRKLGKERAKNSPDFGRNSAHVWVLLVAVPQMLMPWPQDCQGPPLLLWVMVMRWWFMFYPPSLDPGQTWTNRVDYSSRACSQAGFCEKFGKIYKFWKWILMCDQFLTTQTIAPFILFISQPSLYPPSAHKSFIETSYIWILIGELVRQVKS